MTTIYYLREAYTKSGPKLMGTNAAGKSLLRGFVSHSTGSELWAQVQHLLKEGKALESVEDNLVELRVQSQTFAEKQLRDLKELQLD